MATISELTVKIGADVGGAQRGLDAVSSKVSSLAGVAAAPAKAFGGLWGTLSQGISIAAGFGIFDLVKSGFDAVTGSTIGLNANLEQSKVAFTTMLGSGEQAQAFLTDLQDFAAKTPFEFPELVDASKRMLAFGFSADQVRPLLTSVGDAAAAMGSGSAGIDAITRALGQMQAKGKVSAEEMLQLTEAGIPAWDMLANKLGTDVSGAMDQVTKRTVDANTMITAFQEGAASRFGGMMERQAQTFSGAMSTIKDSLGMAIADGFRPLFDLVSQGAQTFASFVQSDTFSAWAAGVQSSVQGVINLFTGWLNIGRSIFLAFSQDAGAMGLALDYVKTTFGEAAAAGVQPFFQKVMEAIPGILAFGQNLRDFAGGVVQAARQAIGGDLSGAFQTLQQTVSSIGPALVTQLAGWGRAFLEWMGPVVAEIPGRLTSLGQSVLGFIQQHGPTIASTLLGWGRAFVEWISPVVGQLPGVLMALGERVLGFIRDHGPGIASTLEGWGRAFLGWVQPAASNLLSGLVGLGGQVLEWIVGQVPTIAGMFGQWSVAFVRWLGEAIPNVLAGLGDLITGVLDSIGTGGTEMSTKTGSDWGKAFVDWVGSSALPALAEALPKILTAILDFIGTVANSAYNAAIRIGSQIISGIVGGITSGAGRIANAAAEAASSALNSAKQALGIHSPSREFWLVGENIAEGLALGMLDNLERPKQAARTLADEVLDEMASFTRSIDSLSRETEARFIQIGERAGDAINKALVETDQAIKEAQRNAVEALEELKASRDLDLTIRVRREGLAADLDKDARRKAREWEDEETAYRLMRDLERAKTAEEKAEIRKRAEYAAQDLQFRRDLEEKQRVFRAEQEEKRRILEDKLDQEAYDRQRKRIDEDAQHRIDSLNKALAEKQKEIQDDAERERKDLLTSYAQRVADLREQFVEKLPEALGPAEAIVNGFLDRIAAKTSSTAQELADLVGLAWGESGNGGASSEPTPDSGSHAALTAEGTEYTIDKPYGEMSEAEQDDANRYARTRLASGGVALDETPALIGDGGEAEAVVPLSKWPALVAASGGGASIDYERLGRAVAQALNESPPRVAVDDIRRVWQVHELRNGGRGLGGVSS